MLNGAGLGCVLIGDNAAGGGALVCRRPILVHLGFRHLPGALVWLCECSFGAAMKAPDARGFGHGLEVTEPKRPVEISAVQSYHPCKIPHNKSFGFFQAAEPWSLF